jgi:ADP-heptose:LPS heptosyltransferase
MFFRMAGFKSILAQKGFAKNLRPKAKEGTLIRKPKEADALLERLRIDGLQVPLNGQGCMDLQITHAERGKVKKWWHKKGETCAPWVAVCTGGKTNSQLWPWERYGEVMHLLIKEQGLFPIVVGGREDREIGEKLVRQWGTGLCAAGELSVRESAALMEGARFYLGNDTGVMHLAAAVGIPCVAIFSARNWPGTWEPYGSGHKVLRFDVPCSGCSLSTCNQQLQCLSNITVQEVYRACLEVLGSGNALKTKSC